MNFIWWNPQMSMLYSEVIQNIIHNFSKAKMTIENYLTSVSLVVQWILWIFIEIFSTYLLKWTVDERTMAQFDEFYFKWIIILKAQTQDEKKFIRNMLLNVWIQLFHWNVNRWYTFLWERIFHEWFMLFLVKKIRSFYFEWLNISSHNDRYSNLLNVWPMDFKWFSSKLFTLIVNILWQFIFHRSLIDFSKSICLFELCDSNEKSICVFFFFYFRYCFKYVKSRECFF